mgnify:CR=1 FL=1
MNNRIDRINSEVRKAISTIVANEIKDPRVNVFITITKVEVSADLSHCKVFVSLLGSEENNTQTFNILKSSSSYIRKSLSQKLNMRITPEIHFFLDTSWEEGEKMDKLISKLNIPKE